MEESSPQVIVDVGCAMGTFIKSMKNLHPVARTIGIDINPLAVAECVVSGHEAYTNEQFEYIHDEHFSQFQNTTFTFWDSLEHMRDPIDFLLRYKPRRVLASLPCLDGFLEVDSMDNLVMWKHYRPQEHLWNFTISQFIQFMERANYQVLAGPLFEECYWRFDPKLKDRNIMTFAFARA
jgi:23S rRNA U2552 (ribose-2'-O)-methylase RlmE/FtsJ